VISDNYSDRDEPRIDSPRLLLLRVVASPKLLPKVAISEEAAMSSRMNIKAKRELVRVVAEK
jgi:hypothetical protein